MATGEALICKLKNIATIEGADNIVQANMFGETVIISKDYKEGQLGLLIDCESILSEEFCHKNNLFRHTHLNENPNAEKPGYFDDTPRVRPIKLRSVKCSAFWIPIESLDYIKKGQYPAEGTQINEWQGHEICKKYEIAKRHTPGQPKQQKKVQQVLNFVEHLDTDQLLRNLHKIQLGDKVIVTSKVHGTSCRVGLLPTIDYSWKSRFLRWLGIDIKNKYNFVVGSRHCLKYVDKQTIEQKASFYEEDIWTESAKKNFYGKLILGETIYYEIVGYLPSGQPIMPTHDNSKLKNFLEKDEYKEFIKKFGERTEFHYGCVKGKQIPTGEIDEFQREKFLVETKGEYKIFVYRITLTTEHGQAIDLSWEQVKRRCEEMGVNHVPQIKIWNTNFEYTPTICTHLDQFNKDEFWINLTEQDDPNFPTHLNEGICVRVENGGLTPLIFKNKRYTFKVLEGIIKDTVEFADIEESN